MTDGRASPRAGPSDVLSALARRRWWSLWIADRWSSLFQRRLGACPSQIPPRSDALTEGLLHLKSACHAWQGRSSPHALAWRTTPWGTQWGQLDDPEVPVELAFRASLGRGRRGTPESGGSCAADAPALSVSRRAPTLKLTLPLLAGGPRWRAPQGAPASRKLPG